jgi:hypothetical protein
MIQQARSWRRTTSALLPVATAALAAGIFATQGVRWFCGKVLRLDIYSAGGLLIGIGNNNFASLSPTIPLIRQCLRLPEPRTPPAPPAGS